MVIELRSARANFLGHKVQQSVKEMQMNNRMMQWCSVEKSINGRGQQIHLISPSESECNGQ